MVSWDSRLGQYLQVNSYKLIHMIFVAKKLVVNKC